MTIQPLVENAVKHAFLSPRGNTIDISISVSRKSQVRICVKDNGIGMNLSSFDDIISGRCEGHFGLYSVKRCLELVCGKDYSFSAESEPGKGTAIIIEYDAGNISKDTGAGSPT